MSTDPDPTAPAGRWRVTGIAGLQVLLGVPVVVLFVLAVVCSVLTVVWIGVVLLMGVLPLGRAVVNAHRRMAGRVLGSDVPAPYLPLPPGPINQLRVMATDPMTWRDLLWMLWAMTFGFVLSLLAVLLLLVVMTIPLWWYGAVPLMRARCHIDRALLTFGRTEQLEQRVSALVESRAVAVDHSAAELRRIERDLHDGPQARIAAMSLSLGLADDLFETDPDAARRLLTEARSTSSAALGELRDVVRGIHPPVLADRGLGGAVEALALDMAVPVEVALVVPRLPAPVESAVYFTVAECLANMGKHAAASRAWVRLEVRDDVLHGEVGDDGRGGASPEAGTGLRGIAARLGAFDGVLTVTSPAGGPTVVRWEVPCASSSPRITPS